MKKQTFSKFGNAVRNTIVASVLMMGLIPAVHAQDSAKPFVGPVSIKYLGTDNDQPVFQVEFDNESQERVNVSIRDEQGVLLYDGRFTEKKFSKRFRFEKGTQEPVKLKFTLTTGKDKQSQVFEINRNVRMVEDVVVTKL